MNLIIIKGKPNTGKTTLGLILKNYLPNSSLLQGDAITFYALEGIDTMRVANIVDKLNNQDSEKIINYYINIIDSLSSYSWIILEGYIFNSQLILKNFHPQLLENIAKKFKLPFSDHKEKIIKNVFIIEKENFQNFSISYENIIKKYKCLYTSDITKEILKFIKNISTQRLLNKKTKWYQQFDFLNYKADSNSNLKFSKLELPKNLFKLRILDIGCEAGYFSFKCRQAGAEITGIDPSITIKIANEIKNNIYFLDKINFYQKNIFDNFIQSLGLFNYILCLGMFHYISNQQALINKIYDMLIPEGILKLEAGISNTNDITTHNKYYPTMKNIKNMLKRFHIKNITESFTLDSFPRFIITAQK